MFGLWVWTNHPLLHQPQQVVRPDLFCWFSEQCKWNNQVDKSESERSRLVLFLWRIYQAWRVSYILFGDISSFSLLKAFFNSFSLMILLDPFKDLVISMIKTRKPTSWRPTARLPIVLKFEQAWQGGRSPCGRGRWVPMSVHGGTLLWTDRLNDWQRDMTDNLISLQTTCVGGNDGKKVVVRCCYCCIKEKL